MRAELALKLERAGAQVAGLGTALVAYSGGVDSSLVLEIAHRALGPGASAVIARSPSLPTAELEAALALGRDRGIQVSVLDTREVELDGYRRNEPDRCYFCKSELYARLAEVAAARGVGALLDGFNRDDRADWRPGRRAAVEVGVISPLDDAGLGKEDVRTAARELGLANWDKPEAACLSSRVPYGTLITPSLLSRIEQAEEVLHAEGFRQVRVRHGGTTAVIEVERELIPRLRQPARLARVSSRLAALGYPGVEVNLEGYRKGGLNVSARAPVADGP
ncbi:MAG: ATP-dependent sacrificial sulfur transferase LarE [Candidatus Dormibacteraeota bacterium]|nr:ATP-dependent sacrificial sulfur transferase LarE [Candidatus Dormibacteraeota bacterium]